MGREFSDELNEIANEIDEYAKKIGVTAWIIGRKQLGINATAKQISYYLSSQNFGFPGNFSPEMILNFMMRVNPNELSR